jgi:threonine/homoserine/homoserine lactone efflux protein
MELTQTSHLWLFFLLVFGIMVMPGMDMAYVMASSLVGGKKSGIFAVLGIIAGGTLHVLMGILGVGLLLKTMPQLFNLLLLAGSLYIAWMGYCIFRGATALDVTTNASPMTLSATFSRAFVTCLLNPKAYVFMLAIFPQFIRKEYGSMTMQALAMGSIIAMTQALVYGLVVFSAVGMRRWLHSNKNGQIRLGQGIGLLLIAAALWTGLQGWL